MSNSRQHLEKQDKTDHQSESNKQELSRHVQDLQKEDKDKPREAAGKPSESSDKSLPNLTIVDSKNEQAKTTEELPGGGRKVRTEANGRYSEIEYDSNNRPVRYRDFNGEEFENQGVQKDGKDVWKSKTNVVQKDGVTMEIDDKQNVKMTDIATGNTVETDNNGVETTTYPPSGGKTIRKVDGDEEQITTQDANGSVRSMRIKNNELQSYTDAEGNTYTRTAMHTDETNGDPRTRRPLFEKTNAAGQCVDGSYTVTADRSGNVVVRNESPGHENDADYAKRERVDGVTITSNKTNSERDLQGPNGLHIHTTKNADGTTSKTVEDPQGVLASQNPEEAPRMIQRTPPGVDIEKDKQEAAEHRLDAVGPMGDPDPAQTVINMLWFRDQVDYGHRWDFKSPSPDQMAMPEYEDYGNYHYGEVGRAAGFSDTELKKAAGAAQICEGTSKPEWGTPGWGYGPLRIGGTNSYGDDPHDQEMIQAGYDDAAQQKAA